MSRRFHSAVGKLGIQSVKENEFQSYSFLKLLGVPVTVGIFVFRLFVPVSVGTFKLINLAWWWSNGVLVARDIPQMIWSRVDKIGREKEKAASCGTLQRWSGAWIIRDKLNSKVVCHEKEKKRYVSILYNANVWIYMPLIAKVWFSSNWLRHQFLLYACTYSY